MICKNLLTLKDKTNTMLRKFYLLFILLLFLQCSNNNDSQVNSNDTTITLSDGDYQDGTYCAEIEYYNPDTGTRNTYNLDVEVESGELTVIHWPNGGWLDDSHFTPQDVSGGSCSFTSDRGYQYTVTLVSKGGCGYTDGNRLRNDVNDEVQATTCPNCGGDKDSFDELCSSCEEQRELTCPQCGGRKTFSTDDVCDDCESENDNQNNEF